VPNSAPRLLLIDDDQELASLMREFFAGQGEEIALAYDGPTGLEMALSGTYSLVILDVMLPGFDGFEVLRRLREKSDVPVLMLTALAETESRLRGFDAGADDYLPKPFEPLELLGRVRAILRRTQAAPRPAVTIEVSGVRLETGERAAYLDGRRLDLTSVEYEILKMLMTSAGSVVTRDDVAMRLYNRPATPFDRSIDVHVSHLRRKLEGPRELIRTVRGAGYQFVAEGGRP
jgi:two-component system, OmpR family, response regulator CpxR